MLNDTEEILHGLALIDGHWLEVGGSHPNESFISTCLRDARAKIVGHELSDSFALGATFGTPDCVHETAPSSMTTAYPARGCGWSGQPGAMSDRTLLAG